MIWGICTKRRVNPLSFKGDSATMEQLEGGLSIFFIRKVDVSRFDTSYKIPLSKLPIKKLRRQEEYCDEDGFKRIRYL
jgi:hypothetical protein